jgi:hypothetical protein
MRARRRREDPWGAPEVSLNHRHAQPEAKRQLVVRRLGESAPQVGRGAVKGSARNRGSDSCGELADDPLVPVLGAGEQGRRDLGRNRA